MIVSKEFLGSVRVEVLKFKALMEKMFDVHCQMGLYTLKFYFIEHIVQDLN